jgi:hypothetical protein
MPKAAPPMTTPQRAESSAGVAASARAVAPAAMRPLVAALLVVALALGAWLRCANLGAREMSADEGATWAAAAAPSLKAVVREQAILNPGKLALQELALRGWMRLFGDGLAAMRALSAALDTLSIVIVFLLTRELFGGPPAPHLREGMPDAPSWPALALGGMPFDEAEMVAALAALLFAVNLVTIKYAREIRMYALALLLVLAQLWFFLRAARRGGRVNLGALAVLTALAVSAHFGAAFMVAAEALCLPFLPDARSRGAARPPKTPGARWIRVPVPLAAALGAGLAIFLVIAASALRTGASAFAHGATSWIERPPWWAPLALFNKGTGTFGFPATIALAGWGVWRGWRRAPGAVAFALAWMWLPPMLLLLASYAFAPMFVERYALWSFVPFFILAALGTCELPTEPVRAGALALVVVLALGHLHAYRGRPHGAQWREAARAAASGLAPGATIAVAPPYAVNVVRYYLRDTPAAGAAVPANDAQAEVVVIDQHWIRQGKAAKLLADYPQPVARLRGVRVQHRRMRAQ